MSYNDEVCLTDNMNLRNLYIDDSHRQAGRLRPLIKNHLKVTGLGIYFRSQMENNFLIRRAPSLPIAAPKQSSHFTYLNYSCYIFVV